MFPPRRRSKRPITPSTSDHPDERSPFIPSNPEDYDEESALSAPMSTPPPLTLTVTGTGTRTGTGMVTGRKSPSATHIEALEEGHPHSGSSDDPSSLPHQPRLPVSVTPTSNRRILRLLDLHILPIILTIYFLQYLDKATLSYASVFGLPEDLHLRGDQFGWAGAIVYVAQLVWQPVIAWVLVAFPLGKFCAAIVGAWGVTLCAMAAVRDFTGLMVARFVLGSCEAAVAPLFIALVQMWYRRGEQTNRNAGWYSMVGVVNVFGSLLSYGLARIHSDALRPYQVIFLFCGCLTVAFSAVIYLFLPDSPMQARFLKGEDKLLAVERVRMNQMGAINGVWRWDQVRECLLDLKTWFWFSMLTVVSIPSGGISTFGPLIVKSFGLDSFSTILFNMPIGVVQLVAILGSAVAATQWKMKSPILAVLCVFPIIGLGILLSYKHTAANRGVLLFAYYLTSVYPAITPLIYSWSSQNTGGDTKRKMTTAVMFIGASAGNIIGPNLYTTAEAPEYHRGILSNLILFCILLVLIRLSALWIWYLNKRHRSWRERMGKPARPLDLSMQNRKKFDDQEAINRIQSGGVGQKAFDDVTDLKNEDFIFVY